MGARRIAYVQHANALGGSCVSLLELVRHLDPQEYDPVILCLYDAPEVLDFYRAHGIATEVVHGEMFRHTTAGWWPLTSPLAVSSLFRWMLQFPAANRRLRETVAAQSPRLVHLNSLTLLPYAPGLSRLGIPIVAHVREAVAAGHFGVRRAILKRISMRSCAEIIYICEDNQVRLTGKAKGLVIYNSVDLADFKPRLDRKETRSRLRVGENQPMVLMLGGLAEIKGGLPFLRALDYLVGRIPDLAAVVAGQNFATSSDPFVIAGKRVANAFGWRSYSQRVQDYFFEHRLDRFVRLLPFQEDVAGLIVASDVVVFPAVDAHFSRPVMEAAILGKPSVASRVGGVTEIVEDGVTGLLVSPGDWRELAEGLTKILRDRQVSAEMGLAAQAVAVKRFNAIENTRQVTRVYDRILEASQR